MTENAQFTEEMMWKVHHAFAKGFDKTAPIIAFGPRIEEYEANYYGDQSLVSCLDKGFLSRLYKRAEAMGEQCGRSIPKDCLDYQPGYGDRFIMSPHAFHLIVDRVLITVTPPLCGYDQKFFSLEWKFKALTPKKKGDAA